MLLGWLSTVHIGGRRNTTTGLYYWYGLLTHAVPLYGSAEADWDGSPGGGGDCMRIKRGKKWLDKDCVTPKRFVCETVSRTN